MFGKYRFRVKSNWILTTKFRYDVLKLHPAQRSTYDQIIHGCFGAKGRPADAAVMFMLVQVNSLDRDARRSPLVEHVFATVEELEAEMSPEALSQLPVWLLEFAAESVLQAQEASCPKGRLELPSYTTL